MKRVLYILTPLLLLTQSGYSQRVLTLEECQALAVENNTSLKERRLEIEIAQQRDKEIFTNFFPSISASAGYFNTTDPMLATDIETSTLPLPEMGLPGVIPVGMINKGSVASLTAMQTLYGGGLVRNANRLSNLGVELSELQYAMSNDEVALKSEEYYWQCVKLRSKSQIIASAMEQLRELKRQVERYVDAGVVNVNDLMRVELELSRLEGDDLAVRNGERLSKLMLAQYIGLTSDSFVVMDNAEGALRDPSHYLVDFNEAVEASNEASMLGKKLEAGEIEIKMAQGERLPKVAVGGAYAYNNLLDKNNDFFVGMATLSVPITGWWSGAHKLKQAKLRYQQSEVQYNDTMERLHLQMTQLYLSLTESYQQIAIAERRVAQAEENLRLNRNIYAAGKISLVELLESQTLLEQSLDAMTEARLNYRISLSRYLQRTASCVLLVR